MSEQNGMLSSTLQRPTTSDREAWKAYWEAYGQPWRIEPEIDLERQAYLAQRRTIEHNIEQGIYPFKDIKLTRADVEWLLATHDGARGPLDHVIGGHARGLDLRGADLRGVDLSRLPLTQLRGGLRSAEWHSSTKEQREAAAIHLEGASLNSADLTWATLRSAHLEGTDLRLVHLEGATLRGAHLEGADLGLAFFDNASTLHGVTLGSEKHECVSLADVSWNGANLAVLDWASVKMLGDERKAHQAKKNDGTIKEKEARIDEYRIAVRSNRQLAIALQAQGLNEEAARFAYRAQKLQRTVFRLQGISKFGQYLFSLFLDLLAGYGYKPWRSFLAYLVVIGLFAATYYYLGPHLAWNEAIVISMTAFHGRGFFPDQFKPGDPQALVAAIEAFVGLLIEVTLIATLTQRLFGK